MFEGQYITITRKDDGTMQPNFKKVTTNGDFPIYKYAVGVWTELLQSLPGLLGK